MTAEVVFLLAFLPLVSSYFLYPVALWLIASLARRPEVAPGTDPAHAPSVALVVAAYNEEEVIEAKIENMLALAYPPERLSITVVSDGSSDATCERARVWLAGRTPEERARVNVIERQQRTGKTIALSDTVSTLDSEVLVFSDANTLYEPDAISRLVAPLADPRVGLVCGNLHYVPSGSQVAGEALYWRYENALKRLEGRLGRLLVANGSIYAVRRELFEPVPGPVADDLAVPLVVASKGYERRYEREAVAHERLPVTSSEEFRAKARIVAQGLEAVGYYRREILRSGPIAMLQLLLHKVIRWFAVPLMAVMLAASLLGSGPMLASMLAGQFVFYALALVGSLVSLPRWLPHALLIPSYYCLVSAAALRGVWDFLRRRPYALWEKSESTRASLGLAEASERPARSASDVPWNGSGRRVAVVGGSGFIGTRVISELVAAGCQVRNGDVVESPEWSERTVYCDARRLEDLSELFEGADAIIHLAAEHRDDVRPASRYYDVNVEGTERVCEAAALQSIPQIVFTSTVAVYPPAEAEIGEETTPGPESDYGKSKWMAEQVLRKWLEQDPARSLVIVRPTAVFGEGGHGNVTTLIRQLIRGRFVMVGSGRNIKSLAYVGNLAAFLRHSLDLGAGEHLVNYVDKPDMDVKTLVERVDRSLGRSGSRPHVPYWMASAAGWCFDLLAELTGRELVISRVRVKKFCSRTQFSAGRVADTGFAPPHAIDDALDRTLAWGSGQPLVPREEPELAESELPLVSLIVPMRNERRHIGECLETLLSQDYPREKLEVLVVDGRSSDGSADIVREYAERHPGIRLLENERQITPAAFNIGVKNARGDLVGLVSAHSSLAASYVRECVSALHRSGADGVGGVMRPEGSGHVGEAIGLALASRFGAGDSKYHYATEESFVDTVPLAMYRREVFERVGLFDETLIRNQDFEFNYRVRSSGGRLFLSPRISFGYSPRESLGALWRQYYQYGRWKVRTLFKHPRSLRWRQAMPPLLVGTLVASALLSPLHPAPRWIFAAAALAYTVAVLGASVAIAMRGGTRYLPTLPAVLATMHVSWGLGFLTGLASELLERRRSGA